MAPDEMTHIPADLRAGIQAYDDALADGTLVIVDTPHDQPVFNGYNPFAPKE